MAFRKTINDLNGLIILVVLTLPSIAANVDCNDKPFHCVNTTHFMICVDLGSGISSTIDDFVIPCPPTTVCKETNHFECEFPTVTIATTVASTSQGIDASVGKDTYELTTSIPFEEYYDTVRTTTLFENVLTQQTIITEPVNVDEVTENINVITLRSEYNSTLSETTKYVTEAVPINPVTHTPSYDNIDNIATNSDPDETENVTVVMTESPPNALLENSFLSPITGLNNNPDPITTSNTTVSSAITLDIVSDTILSARKNISSSIAALQNDLNSNNTSSSIVLPAVSLDTGNDTILTEGQNTSGKIATLQNVPDSIKTPSTTVLPAITSDIGNATITNTASTTLLPAMPLDTGNETLLTSEKYTSSSSTIAALQNDLNSNNISSPIVLPAESLDTGNDNIFTEGQSTSSTIATVQNVPDSMNTPSTTVLPAITSDIGNAIDFNVGTNNLTIIADLQNGPDPTNTASTTLLPAIPLDTGNETLLTSEKYTSSSSTIAALQNYLNSNNISSTIVLPSESLDTGNENILSEGQNTSSTIATVQNVSDSINTPSTTVLPAITSDIGNATDFNVGINNLIIIADLQNGPDPTNTASTTLLPAIPLDTGNNTLLTSEKYTSSPSTIAALQNGSDPTNTSSARVLSAITLHTDTSSTTVLPTISLDTGNETLLTSEKYTLSSSTVPTLQNKSNRINILSPTVSPAFTLDTGNETIVTKGQNTSSKIVALQNSPDPTNTSSPTVLPAITLDISNETILTVGKNPVSTIAALHNSLGLTDTSIPTTVLPTISLDTDSETLLTSEKYTSSSSTIAALKKYSNPINTSSPTELPTSTLDTGNYTILTVGNKTLSTITALHNGPNLTDTFTNTVLPTNILDTPGDETLLTSEKYTLSSGTIAALRNDSNSIETSTSTVLPANSVTLDTGNETTLTVSKNSLRKIFALQNSSDPTNTTRLTVLPALALDKANETILTKKKYVSTTIAALYNDEDQINTSKIAVSPSLTSEHDTTLHTLSNTTLSDSVADIVTELIKNTDIADVIISHSEKVSKDIIQSTDPASEYYSQNNYSSTFPDNDALLNETLKLATIESKVNKTLGDDALTMPGDVVYDDFTTILNMNNANLSSVVKVMSISETTFLNELNINQTNATLQLYKNSDPGKITIETQNKSESIMTQSVENTFKSKQEPSVISPVAMIVETASNHIPTVPIHEADFASYNNVTDNKLETNKTNYIATSDDGPGYTSKTNTDSPGVTAFKTKNETEAMKNLSLNTTRKSYEEPATIYLSEIITHTSALGFNKTTFEKENKTKSTIASFIEATSESYQTPDTVSLSKAAAQSLDNNGNIDIIEITSNPTLQKTLHGTATHNDLKKNALNISQENRTSNMAGTDYALLNTQIHNDTFSIKRDSVVTTILTENKTEALMATDTKFDFFRKSAILSAIETNNAPATVNILNYYSDFDDTVNTTESIADPSESYQKHRSTTTEKPAVLDNVEQLKISGRDNITRPFGSKQIISKSLQAVSTTNTIDITENIPVTTENTKHILAKQIKSAETINDTTYRPLTSKLASKVASTSPVSMTKSAYVSAIVLLNRNVTAAIRAPTVQDILKEVTVTENYNTDLETKMSTAKNFVHIINKNIDSHNINVPLPPISNTNSSSVRNYAERFELVNPITAESTSANEKPPINVESTVSKFELSQSTDKTQTTSGLLANTATSSPITSIPEFNLSSTASQNTINNKQSLNMENVKVKSVTQTTVGSLLLDNLRSEAQTLSNVISDNVKTSPLSMGEPELKMLSDTNRNALLNLTNFNANETLLAQETSIPQTDTIDIARENLLSNTNIQKSIPGIYSALDSPLPAAINSSFNISKVDSHATISSDVTATNSRAVFETWKATEETNIQTVHQHNNISGTPLAVDIEIIDIPKEIISQKTAPITTSISSPSQLDADIILLDVKPTHSWTPVISKPTQKTDFEYEQFEKEVDDEKPETKNKVEELFEEQSDSNIAGQNKVSIPTNSVSSNFDQNTRLSSKGNAADVTLSYANQMRLDTTIEFTTRKMEEKSATQSITNIEQISTATSPQKDLIRLDNTSNQNVRADTRTSNVDKGPLRYIPQTITPLTNKHNNVQASESEKPNSTNFICEPNVRGRFSDSKDCRKFYICIGRPEPIEGICPNATVFSELWKQCTKNLSHCVRHHQFQCTSEGRFSDYLKDNVYYICVKNNKENFIRFRLQCQSGYHLNRTSVRCELNTELNYSTSQQSMSDQSMSSAKSEKLVDKSSAFECIKEGKFPDPNECRRYYVCSKRGKSQYRQKRKQCDSDEIFHKDKKKCVDADSYDCN